MINRWAFVSVVAVGVVMIAVAFRSRADSVAAAPASAIATTVPSTAPANENQIEIDDFVFKPKELHVAVGTKVTWVNKDDVPHTATSSDEPALFDSRAIDTDETYSFIFTKPGTYKYFCKVHPHMKGVVIVK